MTTVDNYCDLKSSNNQPLLMVNCPNNGCLLKILDVKYP